jgi:Putative auto-transporter adhesin, head GIN domain
MKFSVIFSLAGALLLHTFAVAQSGTETRSLGSFDKINVAGAYNVILKPGDVEQVVITAKGIKTEAIETEVAKNTLSIGTKRGYNTYARNTEVTIVVTYRTLNSVSSSGSSDISTDGVLKGENFVFNGSGSGDFKGELDVKTLKVNLAGSSDVTLAGRANEQGIAISGSGDVNASNLSGTTADVAISGSGDVSLNVSGRVKSSVSGSGEVENRKN